MIVQSWNEELPRSRNEGVVSFGAREIELLHPKRDFSRFDRKGWFEARNRC